MTDREQRAAAKQFAEYWKDKGYEKGESQAFWLSLLRDVLGVKHPEQFISFEEQVHLDHTSFIDGHISATKVLVEQKSVDKDLNKAIKQSDGSLLTPFAQAKRYITELPLSQHPRWVVTCNFKEFYVYDMERPGGDPEIIKLEDLPKEYYRLEFLVKTGDEHLAKEMEVSIAAGDIVGKIYDAFHEEYKNPDNEESLKSLNKLCVRLVFCLYAEDAGIFGSKSMFHDYLAQFDAKHMRTALIDLFKVLDQKPEERDSYLEDDLAAFPYVNGGLFSDENIEIPYITDEIRDLLLNKASADFDWSDISPTIFGAVFESTLNQETRRKGGMHYTSIENIHKVIDPLFLDGLNEEFEEICQIKVAKTRESRLYEFQDKLASLKFLDPACGSGNFLTETYLSLRRLENRVLKELHGDQMVILQTQPIKVSIQQFYGIEINDFAVTVATTALWIAESQMMKETENIVGVPLTFLPLKTYTNITEGNALRLKWEDVLSPDECSYIMGNPPFIGYSLQNTRQKEDIRNIYIDENGKPYKAAGKIDYVAGWYWKASEYIKNNSIRVAFVSTNSITQGEQVAGVWEPLFERFGIHIDFAHRTFIWDSEANIKAYVHCVIVGFSNDWNMTTKDKVIYYSDRKIVAKNINAYLIDAGDIFISSKSTPICNVPKMTTGNRPADGGNLIIESDEYDEFVKEEPKAVNFIKKLTGSEEYINNKKRYCLWLVGCSPKELRTMPKVLERVEKCKQDRLKGAPDRQKLANTPTLFRETKNPENYLLVPLVSSEKRRYIPVGFLNKDTIPTNSATIIEGASFYEFGILESNVHMSWMRTVCGRLKSDYRYSKDIVYNNFPWPSPTPEQKAKIEKTAQGILDARALYPDSSLADLYDELTMPPELRKAHQLNDLAVMQAYGFTRGTEAYSSEAACVAELMKMYQKKVKESM